MWCRYNQQSLGLGFVRILEKMETKVWALLWQVGSIKIIRNYKQSCFNLLLGRRQQTYLIHSNLKRNVISSCCRCWEIWNLLCIKQGHYKREEYIFYNETEAYVTEWKTFSGVLWVWTVMWLHGIRLERVRVRLLGTDDLTLEHDVDVCRAKE